LARSVLGKHAIRYRQISNQILNKRATVIARSEAPKGQATKQSDRQVEETGRLLLPIKYIGIATTGKEKETVIARNPNDEVARETKQSAKEELP
jgi:hypothetical protein